MTSIAAGVVRYLSVIFPVCNAVQRSTRIPSHRPQAVCPLGPAPKGSHRIQVSRHVPLDDPSRLQGLAASLDCLRHAVGRTRSPHSSISYRQCEDLLHCSPQLAGIAGSLDTPIIPCGPYQPEGRIKVERRSRTLRHRFLTNLDPKRRLLLEDCPALIDSGRRLLIYQVGFGSEDGIDSIGSYWFYCNASNVFGQKCLVCTTDLSHVTDFPEDFRKRSLFLRESAARFKRDRR
jgi:hypothetical protein